MNNNYHLTNQMPTINVVNGFKLSNNETVTLKVNSYQVIGQGTFGFIEKANIDVLKNNKDGDNSISEKFVGAIKKVHQDPRYKNRELNIIQKIRCHPNIVEFKYYYYSIHGEDNKQSESSNRSCNNNSTGACANNLHTPTQTNPGPVNNGLVVATAVNTSSSTTSSSSSGVYLHLVMECVPECLSDLIVRHHRAHNILPAHHIRLYTFQMLRALAHLHSLGVCHRDIKTSNLLVDESRLVLKLCDFGSAKQLVSGSPSVSYISSRYYRAPELLFGAQQYTTSIDVWSAGCVLGEMLRMSCLFTGSDTVDQIVKVIRVLGTPTASDLQAMNPSTTSSTNGGSSGSGTVPSSAGLPHVLPCPIRLFFPHHCPHDLLDLLAQMLQYNPQVRPQSAKLLLHAAFSTQDLIGSGSSTSCMHPALTNFLADELASLSLQERNQLLARYTTLNTKSSD